MERLVGLPPQRTGIAPGDSPTSSFRGGGVDRETLGSELRPSVTPDSSLSGSVHIPRWEAIAVRRSTYSGDMSRTRSPLLDRPGAVEADGLDAGVAAHYGSGLREQRALVAGQAFVDLSHRDVVTITGPDRLTWLHALTTQYFEGLKPGTSTTALLLSPTGHIEHVMYGVDDGETFWLHTEPGAAEALVDWLQKMVFMSRVEIADVTDGYAIIWRPGPAPADGPLTRSGADSLGGHEVFLPRAGLAGLEGPAAGVWAF